MKILVACEESQVVCNAFRAKGHEAWSCDILPTSGSHPEWHIQDDVMNVLRHDIVSPFSCEYDMVIAFPPCTDLAVSGARWFEEKRKDGRQQKSIMFFEFFTYLKNKYVAIENPIGIMSSLYRKPDQIIQPWQFGHGETKATCLWLKNLPLLVPTDIVEGREQKVWKMPPSEDRAKLRSKTYKGIAEAMADQWNFII
jgi:site-specific DNA-cytosine methylase